MSPNFLYPSQGTVLWDSSTTPSRLHLRGFHPLWQAFPGHFSFADEEEAGPITPHPLQVFPARFSLDSSLFARCYWGNPIWFLFLSLLRCFSSEGSHSHTGVPRFRGTAAGSPIQVSPVLKLHTLTRGSFAAGRALLQLSSLAIPQTA